MKKAVEMFRKAGATASYSGKTRTLYVKGISQAAGTQLILDNYGRHNVFQLPCFVKYQ